MCNQKDITSQIIFLWGWYIDMQPQRSIGISLEARVTGSVACQVTGPLARFCLSYMHRGKMQLVRASTFKKFVRARNQSDRINEHLLHCCQSVGHCCFMLRLIASIIFRRLKGRRLWY